MGLAIVFAFVAGLITAVSPCVLPVLPIVLAGRRRREQAPPVRDHRRPRALLPRLDPVRDLDSRPARPAEGPAAQHLDRAAVRDRGRADRPPGRRVDRAAADAALAPPGRRPRRGLRARLRARVRLRPVRGPALALRHASAASGDFGLKAFLVAAAYTLGFSVVLLAIALGGRAPASGCASGIAALPVAFGAVIAALAVRAPLQPRRGPGEGVVGRRRSSRLHRGERVGLRLVQARRQRHRAIAVPATTASSRAPRLRACPDFAGIDGVAEQPRR